jgi:RimJ/RimL family protein N-acetyltransferase
MKAMFESERLTMRPLSTDDAEALHDAYRDVDLMRWWSSAPHADLAETRAYLTPRATTDPWTGWAITLDGTAIGTVSAHRRRPGVYEIGYLLARRYWGQGYAREAVSRLIDLLIVEEGARRIFADTDPDNAGSIALLERLGFRREGLLREEWETHIGIRDTLLLGLLAHEWRCPTEG